MNNRQKAAFEILAKRMDDRQTVIEAAKEIYKKYGNLPKEQMHLLQYFDEKPWRENRDVFLKIVKAAKKAVKNKK